MSGSAVPIIRSVDPTCFANLDTLPDDAVTLFDAADADLFGSVAWYRTVLAAGMPAGAAARFVLCRSTDGGPVALFPMKTVGRGATFEGLTTPYSCRYHPLIAGGLGPDVVANAFFGFARFCRTWPITRIEALPMDWLHLGICTASAQAAGLAVRRFDHFGNWYEAVDGMTWQDYLTARPGRLRETIRRKLRRSKRDAEYQLRDGFWRRSSGAWDGRL